MQGIGGKPGPRFTPGMEHQSDGGLSLPRPFSFWQTCQVRRFLVLGTFPRGTAIRFTRYATLRDCQLAAGEISGDPNSCYRLTAAIRPRRTPRTSSGRDPPRTVVFNRFVRRTSKLTYGVSVHYYLVARVH